MGDDSGEDRAAATADRLTFRLHRGLYPSDLARSGVPKRYERFLGQALAPSPP